MICINIPICFVLFASVFSGVTANCEPNTLQKCADIIQFVASRSSVIGNEMLREFCRFNENVTICADAAALRCPNLKDEDYETLIRVTTKIDKEACMNGSYIQKVYKKHENCISTIDDNNVVKCAQEFIVTVQVLKDSTDKDLCCTFTQAKTCIHDLVVTNCGNEAANASIEVANLLATPLVGPRCKDFDYTMCNTKEASSSLTPTLFLIFLLTFLPLSEHW